MPLPWPKVEVEHHTRKAVPGGKRSCGRARYLLWREQLQHNYDFNTLFPSQVNRASQDLSAGWHKAEASPPSHFVYAAQKGLVFVRGIAYSQARRKSFICQYLVIDAR